MTELLDEFTPTTQSELARFVTGNAAGEKRPLLSVGGRTSLNFGYQSSVTGGVTIATSELTQVIDYPARDMTVTVEAGIRMNDLTELLAEEGQQLPIDVAQSQRATLGGVLATNTSGPRRYGYGTLRDYVIGISAVDAAGRLFKAGGRVVKNVAGYDLCKMLVGSMGTLAIVTQVTLKLKPIPDSSAFVWAQFNDFDDIDVVLERLTLSDTRPISLEVFDRRAAGQLATESRRDLPSEGPILLVGFDGGKAEVDWQVEALRHELAPFGSAKVDSVEGDATCELRQVMTEFAICADAPLTFRANLLPSQTIEFLEDAEREGVTLQAHAGNGIVVGHLPDDVSSAERAMEIIDPLRQLAVSHHGNLIILDCPADWKADLLVFGEAEPSWGLMSHLKGTLDPDNLLNPGRFFDGAKTATVGESHS